MWSQLMLRRMFDKWRQSLTIIITIIISCFWTCFIVGHCQRCPGSQFTMLWSWSVDVGSFPFSSTWIRYLRRNFKQLQLQSHLLPWPWAEWQLWVNINIFLTSSNYFSVSDPISYINNLSSDPGRECLMVAWNHCVGARPGEGGTLDTWEI